MDVFELADKLESSFGVGAARIVRVASVNDLEGDVGEHVGDAILASLELSLVRNNARSVNVTDTQIRIIPIITQGIDYSEYHEESRGEVARKSIIVWENVLSAIDRKVFIEHTGEWVHLLHQDVKAKDLKAFISAFVLEQLARDSHNGRHHEGAVNPIELWRRALGRENRSDFYSGVMIMSSVFAGETSRDDVFVRPELHLNPPEYFAKPFLNVAFELKGYPPDGNRAAVRILNSLIAGVVGYNYLLNLPLDQIEDTITQKTGFKIGDKTNLNRMFIGAFRDHIYQIEDENDWRNMSNTEAFSLMYLGRMLNPNNEGEDVLFQQLVNFGLHHEDPSVRLMAFRTLVRGEALVEGWSDNLEENYTTIIHDTLFGRISPDTKQVWQEVMKQSSMRKAAQWLLEVLYDDNKMRRLGKWAFDAFVVEKGNPIHEFVLRGETDDRNAINELADAVESRWNQLYKSNPTDLGVLSSYIAACKTDWLLKD